MLGMKDKKIGTDLKSLVAGMAVGSILVGSGVYASTVSAGNVSYSNSSSGLNSTNAPGAGNSLYQTSKSLKSTNDTLKYLHYYTHSHKTNIQGSIFSKGKQSFDGVFSIDDYYKIYYYATLSTSTANSAKSGFASAVNTCCRQSAQCNATSGTCVDKCVSGYDDIYKSCAII